MTRCQVGSCNQQACLASGEDRVCGDHWKATLAYRETQNKRTIRLQRIDEAESLDDIRPLLREIVERLWD